MSIKVAAKLEGAEDAMKAANKLVKKLGNGGEISAHVGFGTTYALAVHELTEVFHKVGGPKFLESAINDAKRGYTKDLADKTWRFIKQGHSHPLAKALYQKALQVEAAAVKRTPVDTGRLRSSHFVVPPKGVGSM